MNYTEVFEKVSLGSIYTENTLVFKFNLETQFQNNPIRSIQNNPSPYILPMNVSSINDFSNLTYTLSTKIKLSDFLNYYVSRLDFLKLLFQITQVIKDANNYYANENNFILDEEYIYVEPQKMVVSLMYFPVEIDVNINQVYKRFIERVLKGSKTVEQADTNELMNLVSRASYRMDDVYKLLYILINERETHTIQSQPVSNVSNCNNLENGILQESRNFPVEKKEIGEVHKQEISNSKIDSKQIPKPPMGIPRGNKKKKAKNLEKKEIKKKPDRDWGNIITNFIKAIKNGKHSEKEKTNRKTFLDSAKDTEKRVDDNLPLQLSRQNKTNSQQEHSSDKCLEFSNSEIRDSQNYSNNNFRNLQTSSSSEINKGVIVKECMNQHSEGLKLLDYDRISQTILDINYEGTQLFCKNALSLPIAYLSKEENGVSKRYNIRKSIYKIGRDASVNDLVLDSKKVSKKHAEIYQEEGAFYITDKGSEGKGSTNGVYLNEIKLEKITPFKLKNGDEIRIIESRFKFYLE